MTPEPVRGQREQPWSPLRELQRQREEADARLTALTDVAIHAASDAPEEGVGALAPSSTGRWLITTMGSRHVLDLDRSTYQRLPGPDAPQFDHDRAPARLDRIEIWPEIGRSFLLFFDDPDNPAIEHYRLSSAVLSIRPVAGSDPDDQLSTGSR